MSHDTITSVPPGPVNPIGPGPARPDPGARPTLRVLGVGLALALVGYGAIVLVSLITRVTEHTSGTYSGIRMIELDVGFEAIDVVGSETAGSVSMERSYAWSLTRPTVGQHQDGDRLVITSACPASVGIGCSGRIRLVVPPDVTLQVRASDGSVQVQDTTGRVTLDLEDAHSTLRHLTGAVDVRTSDGGVTATDLSGRLTIRTSDGAVEATRLRSDRVEVQSSDGAVLLGFAVAPDLVTVRSRDGSVRILVPDDQTTYQVSGATSDGARTVTVPTDSSSDHVIDLETSDGSIEVGTAP